MTQTALPEHTDELPTLPGRDRRADLRAILWHVATKQPVGTYDIINFLQFECPSVALTMAEREYVISLQKEFNGYATQILERIEARRGGER